MATEQDELYYQDQLNTLADENALFRRKLAQNHHEFQLTRSHFLRQEQSLYSKEQEMADLRNELAQVQKSKRDLDRARALDIQAHEREEASWHAKETELTEELVRVRAKVAALEEESMMAAEERRMYALSAQNHDAAVEESMEMLRQARASQTMCQDLERHLATMRAELERERTLLREVVELSRAQQIRIAALESESVQLRRLNQSLAEDCESYEVLLQERTMSGELMKSAVIQKGRSHGRSGSVATVGSDLAAELQRAVSSDARLGGGSGHRVYPSLSSTGVVSPRASFSGNFGEEHPTLSRTKHLENDVARLTSQVTQLKEENRALSLYVNKILSRLVEVDQLENVVSEGAHGKAHRKTMSQSSATSPGTNGKEVEEGVSKWGWRRPQSMIVTGAKPATSVPAKESTTSDAAVPPPGTDEGGLLRKAFKRMSTWRAASVSATPSGVEAIKEAQEMRGSMDGKSIEGGEKTTVASDDAASVDNKTIGDVEEEEEEEVKEHGDKLNKVEEGEETATEAVMESEPLPDTA